MQKFMQKEEGLLKKRFEDLSRMAYRRGIILYTDFLNLNELNIFHSMPKNSFDTPFELFGGYEEAERQMVAFLPDAFLRGENFPICVLEITPVQKKFAEQLNHRDFLGAIMNLRIERCKIGDILVDDCNAIVFVHQSLADYICDSLTRIRHTVVRVSIVEQTDFHYALKTETIRGSIASVRLDTLLSLAYGSSRSKLTALIQAGKVFVNGKLITSNGYNPKEGDIISVRQMGRFRYNGILSETKKGRYYAEIQKYI